MVEFFDELYTCKACKRAFHTKEALLEHWQSETAVPCIEMMMEIMLAEVPIARMKNGRLVLE